MTIDIDAVLDMTPSSNLGEERCVIGRWLDGFPDDLPGRDRLIAAFTTPQRLSPNWRTLEQLDAIARKLGLRTSTKSLTIHRNRSCRCYL